jgi:hypothetical protein
VAADRPGGRAGGLFCARECGGLPLYAEGVARRRCRAVEPLAQRGRERRERRDQFHTLRLGEYLDPFNAAAHSFLARGQAFFLQQTADPMASRQLALQELANLRQQQASSLAYFDSFWLFAALTFMLLFLVLFMKRSVAEKGAHLASE